MVRFTLFQVILAIKFSVRLAVTAVTQSVLNMRRLKYRSCKIQPESTAKMRTYLVQASQTSFMVMSSEQIIITTSWCILKENGKVSRKLSKLNMKIRKASLPHLLSAGTCLTSRLSPAAAQTNVHGNYCDCTHSSSCLM